MNDTKEPEVAQVIWSDGVVDTFHPWEKSEMDEYICTRKDTHKYLTFKIEIKNEKDLAYYWV